MRLVNGMAATLLGASLLSGVARAEPVTILALGDSLTAGYGLAPQDGFAAQLERALEARGIEARVIDAGVSGDTTAGGRERLDWALADDPDVALVELGANDGLRGMDPAATRDNLGAILATLRDRGVPALLLGMLAPPNLGRAYGEGFDRIYPDLAARYGVPLYPFFLAGVAADDALNQPDGLHPTREGVAVIVEGVLPYVVDLVESSGRTDAGRSD
jgi:acyl-CoA thioesterase-1